MSYSYVQAHGSRWTEGVNSCSHQYSQHAVSPLQFPDASLQRDSRRMRGVSDQIFDPHQTPGDFPQNKRSKDECFDTFGSVFGRPSSRMKDAQSSAVLSADALCIRSDQHWESSYCSAAVTSLLWLLFYAQTLREFHLNVPSFKTSDYQVALIYDFMNGVITSSPK